MRTIHFNCYKISARLPLQKIAAYLEMSFPISWKDYIVIRGKHLDMILKYRTTSKQVYLFEFGCATFVNFESDEIRAFLEYLESLTGILDSEYFAKYYETHSIKVYDNGECRLWKGNAEFVEYNTYIIPIVCTVLSRSVALSKIEADADQLLDESEGIITLLQKGKLRASTKKLSSITAKMLRFEYDSVKNIKVLERSNLISRSIEARSIYDILAGYFELSERFEKIRNKCDELRRIVKSYSSLSYKNAENKLLLFETFLLFLFPLFREIRHLLDFLSSIFTF